MRLKNKNAVVVGGSNGIGKAIVEAFLKEGARVFFTAYKDTTSAEQLVAKYSRDNLRFITINAAELENVDKLSKAAEAFLGKIDILVNNAAFTTRSNFFEINLEDYSAVMDINLRFPFFATQRFATRMKDQGIAGSIINISSISAFKAISKMSHYQCSKAALSMLTKSAAYELAPYSIRVNTIAPGLTATNANRNQWENDPELWKERSKEIPLARTGIPSDHASAAIFLASDESSWMTGTEIIIDGGESAV